MSVLRKYEKEFQGSPFSEMSLNYQGRRHKFKQ